MRKAQMEIMGLAVIILIIIFVALIYFRVSSQPASTTNLDINYQSQTINLLTAIMNSRIENTTMQNILKDCEANITLPSGDLACDVLKREVAKIMNLTLLPAQSYDLSISNSHSLLDLKFCPRYYRRYVSNYTLSDVSAQLTLCRSQQI